MHIRLFSLLGIGILAMVAIDPFSIFLGIIAGGLLASAVIIYLVILTIDTIRTWLRQNKPLNKQAVAFAVKTAISGGKVRVITGFYDVEGEHVLMSQTYEAEKLEVKLEKVLKKENEIVLLT